MQQPSGRYISITHAPRITHSIFSENPLKYLRRIHYSFEFVQFYYKSIYLPLSLFYILKWWHRSHHIASFRISRTRWIVNVEHKFRKYRHLFTVMRVCLFFVSSVPFFCWCSAHISLHFLCTDTSQIGFHFIALMLIFSKYCIRPYAHCTHAMDMKRKSFRIFM